MELVRGLDRRALDDLNAGRRRARESRSSDARTCALEMNAMHATMTRLRDARSQLTTCSSAGVGSALSRGRFGARSATSALSAGLRAAPAGPPSPPSRASPARSAVARATWTQTISRGQLQGPLDAAYERPAGRAGRGPRSGASAPACRLQGGAGAARPRSRRGRRRWRSPSGAGRPTPGSRCPRSRSGGRARPRGRRRAGPEAVAIVPARIVSWPSGISARTAQTPSRSLERAPLAGLVARAPGEREGGVEQQHREDEVAHHQARGEVVLDDQGAEDRLADHAERQQGAEEAPGASGRAGGTRRARWRRSRRGRRSR